ncbi:MAG: site-specific integrase [Gammaproteobacteria bacterium]|nr:site-specific integrase [Gammaproteobacteria bacterium]
MPGLIKRRGTWHVDKRIFGRRIYENTGSDSLEEAEKYLARRTEQLREANVYGVRPSRKFREAAIRYVRESQDLASIDDNELHLKQLYKFIGELNLEQINHYSLQPFIEARKKQGRKAKTINLALAVVRRILNLAATEWVDEANLTWLVQAPKIKLLPVRDARKPHPISWEQQDRLFSALHDGLRQMSLYKVNTGCREQEVCQLKWEWERRIPMLNTSVFVIPAYVERNGKLERLVKNGRDRIVVLNSAAKAVIEDRRGVHPEYVFTYKGHPVTAMNNTSWQRARGKVGLDGVRVHDLKHTFGSRLRAAGVSDRDLKDLLGHKSRDITDHYSAPMLQNLIAAAEKACDRSIQGSVLETFEGFVKGNVVSMAEVKLRQIHARPVTNEKEIEAGLSGSLDTSSLKWRARRESNSRPHGS